MTLVERSEALHARVRRFARAEPGETFADLALEIARFQAEFSASFRALCASRGVCVHEADLLPGHAVRVGDTWPIDASKMTGELAALDLTPRAEQAEGLTGRLVRVYERDGKRYGVMEFTGRIAVAEMDRNKVHAESVLNLAFRFEGCINGAEVSGATRSNLTGTVTLANGLYAKTFDRTVTGSVREVTR